MPSEIMRVLSCGRVAEGVFRLVIETPPQAPIPRPGQFYMLRRPGSAVLLPRAISVCDFESGAITFLIQIVGDGTRELCSLNPGDGLRVTGPLGNGFDADYPGKIALVAGSTGAAPFLWTAKALAAKGNPADCFLGFWDEPLLIDEIRPHVGKLLFSTETGRVGEKGLVTQLFNPADYAAVFACGSDPLLRAVVRICEAAGTIPFITLGTKMACGVGACLVCACAEKSGKNRRVCLDGPVFDGREVDFDA